MPLNPYQRRLPSEQTEEETGIPGQGPEQVLQRLGAEPSAKEQAQAQAQPESDVDAYQRLSREAEQAAPTEQDVLAAGIRRSLAESRAETPAFLQQMAETAFYKPDYSQMTKVAQAEAERPDIQLTAKEQAQKRLQGLAEGARKRALLPGEMKRQEASAAEAQARMEALKESSALKARANEPASPEDVAKFNKAYGFLKVTLPDNITRGDLSKAWNSAPEWAAKYATAEKGGATKKEIQEMIQEGKAEDAARKLKEFEVPGVGTALTKDDAKILKQSAVAKGRITNQLNAIKKDYGKLSVSEGLENSQVISDIGTRGKDLVMAYKEYFRLGAPQQAELKFLYDMFESTPTDIGKRILSDKTLGTSIDAKINTLNNILEDAWKEEQKVRLRPKEDNASAAPAQQPAAQPSAIIRVKDAQGNIYDVDRKKYEEGKKAGKYGSLTPL